MSDDSDSAPCHLDCKAFRGWTTQHFHGEQDARLVVFQTPEKRSGSVTFHESWGVDYCGTTSHCETADEAVSLAKRRYTVDVRI